MPKTNSTVPGTTALDATDHGAVPATSSTTPNCERGTPDNPMDLTSRPQIPQNDKPITAEDSMNNENAQAPPTLLPDHKTGNLESQIYSIKQCLLVHDGTHDDFDPSKFSGRYYVERHETPLLSTMSKECNKIIEKLTELKSEMVILHAGHRDLWQGNRVQDVTDNYKYLVTQLAEKTNVRICVSLIIPTGRHYPGFNEKVKSVNEFVSSLISDLRARGEYKNRIFTANNDRLQHYVVRSTGENGIRMKLNSRGKNILWLKLQDSMERTLNMRYRVHKKQQQQQQQSNNHQSRIHHRRDPQTTRTDGRYD